MVSFWTYENSLKKKRIKKYVNKNYQIGDSFHVKRTESPLIRLTPIMLGNQMHSNDHREPDQNVNMKALISQVYLMST